jgi:ABC-type phosphate transport system substrate-binding protein
MIGFLKWALTSGQNQVESLQYARLPASVVAQEEKQLAGIK